MSQNIGPPPPYSAEKIVAPTAPPPEDYMRLDNGIPQYAPIVDNAKSEAAFIPGSGFANNAVDGSYSATQPASGFNNVIVHQPASDFGTSATPFIAGGERIYPEPDSRNCCTSCLECLECCTCWLQICVICMECCKLITACTE